MAAHSSQAHPRRANAGRPRTANDSKGKGNEAASGRGGKDKAGETTKSETSKPPKSKPQNEGEKLVVRRLPPAMAEDEFLSILGTEWTVNQGKVDWYTYAPGKVSKDPSKPSRPSRAYLRLIRKDDIMALSEAVRASKWEDAKNTFTSPSLIAPPAVEFAIYKKTPSNKKRTDARQGTIDQDPQFMAFLEELANPTPSKEGAEGETGEDADKVEVKVTTTPLIEYLKEKKANKGKESSGKNSKNAKADTKTKGASKDEEGPAKKKGKGPKEEKASKAPKEAVKILTKKAATEQAAEAAKNVANQINTTAPTAAATSTDQPKSRRAGIAAAARILQRDLGLSPGSAHRRARQDAAKADSKVPTDKDATSTTSPVPASTSVGERPASPAPSEGSQASKATTSATTKSQSGRRNRGGKNADKNKATDSPPSQAAAAPKAPVILKKPEAEAPQTTAEPANAEPPSSSLSPSAAKPAQAKGKPAPASKKPAAVASDATRAFVKHANPSQGVNEAVLKEALGVFGAITSVEVDKRKGFAYVDFAEHDGLVKAIHANPITVGQTTVQVMERKDKKPVSNTPPSTSPAATSEKPEKSSGRGRRGRGGGGGNKAAGGGDKTQGAPPPATSSGG